MVTKKSLVSMGALFLITVSAAVFALSGCGDTKNDAGEVLSDESGDLRMGESSEDISEGEDLISSEDTGNTGGDTLTFRDVRGKEHRMVIDGSVPSNPYDSSLFEKSGDKMSYNDPSQKTMLGIDVSRHQGDIDWEAVADDGYEFAFIRIAYRGYGDTGSLNEDETALKNLKEAKANGIKCGVYIFSQAVNTDEALEEADFVLDILDGMELEMPVVYDPESILDDEGEKIPEARTSTVTKEEFTAETIAFCDRIKEAGYEPMVYANMLWEAYELDMSSLTQYPFWYADYEDSPQSPYAFTCWQYTNEGKVNGVSGACDINIRMVD